MVSGVCGDGMASRTFSGAGTPRMMSAHQLVGGDAFGQRFVGRHHAMAQHIGRDIHHIGGQHIVAAAQIGQRPARLDHADGGARATRRKG